MFFIVSLDSLQNYVTPEGKQNQEWHVSFNKSVK